MCICAVLSSNSCERKSGLASLGGSERNGRCTRPCLGKGERLPPGDGTAHGSLLGAHYCSVLSPVPGDLGGCWGSGRATGGRADVKTGPSSLSLSQALIQFENAKVSKV